MQDRGIEEEEPEHYPDSFRANSHGGPTSDEVGRMDFWECASLTAGPWETSCPSLSEFAVTQDASVELATTPMKATYAACVHRW